MVKQIIIADDEEDIREVVYEFLRSALPEGAYDYQFCTNGEELDSKLSNGGLEGVVAVITDNDMKNGLKGSEVISKFAPQLRDKIGFFLYYGAVDRGRIGEQAVRDGAVSYHKKPMDVVFLIASVKEYLEGKDNQ